MSQFISITPTLWKLNWDRTSISSDQLQYLFWSAKENKLTRWFLHEEIVTWVFKTRTSKKMTDIDAHHMKAIFFSYTVIYWYNTCLRSSFFWLIFLFNFFFIILYELPCTNPIPQQLTTSDRLILWYLVLQDISLEQPLGLLPYKRIDIQTLNGNW